MSPVERRRKIEAYGHAGVLLREGLKTLPREMWLFKPAPEQWSIHETIVHIADSEANSYIRCRRLIAEPGTAVMAYDENRWASALRYPDQNTEDALQLFQHLRCASYLLIRDLPEGVWANAVDHPQNGRMTLEDWLDVYERHIPEHLAQMRAVQAAWQQRAPR